MKLAYLDASAVVKLFESEPESGALEAALGGSVLWTSSEIVAVEAWCAARRVDRPDRLMRVEEVLSKIELLAFGPEIRDRAAEPFARPLRALAAIHAATALTLRDDLDAFFAYDLNLSSAVAAEGLSVASPGAG